MSFLCRHPYKKKHLRELYFLGSLSQRSQNSGPGAPPRGAPAGLCAPPLSGAVPALLERIPTEETNFIVCKSPDPTPQKELSTQYRVLSTEYSVLSTQY